MASFNITRSFRALLLMALIGTSALAQETDTSQVFVVHTRTNLGIESDTLPFTFQSGTVNKVSMKESRVALTRKAQVQVMDPSGDVVLDMVTDVIELKSLILHDVYFIRMDMDNKRLVMLQVEE
ncbi:MAG: hypothetical protein H6585_08500 [Flavobacteriales bacterium]|nr:hypothetical protein [Flavobacteriales bacterium]MCB9448369.1 hypothetical protein [Flavobacteriales bacterium]